MINFLPKMPDRQLIGLNIRQSTDKPVSIQTNQLLCLRTNFIANK
jgi:hypothetical protein